MTLCRRALVRTRSWGGKPPRLGRRRGSSVGIQRLSAPTRRRVALGSETHTPAEA